MLKSQLEAPLTTQVAPIQAPDWSKWWVWIAPRPYDWVPLCLIIGVLIDCIVQTIGLLSLLPSIGMVLSLSALIGLDRWEYWRYGDATPQRLRVIVLLASLILVELVVQIGQFGLAAFLYVVIPLRAALGFGQKAGIIAGIGISLLYILKQILVPAPLAENISSAILFATAVVFALTLARMTILERRGREHAESLLAALKQSHAELAAYASQSAELATTAERNRLARDIHDSLGHYLTAINIQLEKANAFQHINPHESHQAILSSKRMASEALEDVRHSVGFLRTTTRDLSLTSMIERLAQGWESSVLTIIIEDDVDILLLPARLVLFRAAQEGLTNIRRHADATQVRLVVQCTSDQTVLEITDNGIGFDPHLQAAAPGYGLAGLRERVALLGGQITLESQIGQGTHMRVVIPVRED
jgi:signal transduction histidine kinase